MTSSSDSLVATIGRLITRPSSSLSVRHKPTSKRSMLRYHAWFRNVRMVISTSPSPYCQVTVTLDQFAVGSISHVSDLLHQLANWIDDHRIVVVSECDLHKLHIVHFRSALRRRSKYLLPFSQSAIIGRGAVAANVVLPTPPSPYTTIKIDGFSQI